ncbi:hypothetical protein HZ989_02190 [Brevundimonas sp. AJA228-03]|uniref:hypothetical protein n=1 Tax=Brevundimonas sp. AJA228-03 TaxID=2752515 RepID=UPI001ADF9238|nr:hypothetical protein [Brevundimonas sp. AJA228-03]QTN19911.1 hypothetical protein HZ989_02190 [Brevundimonas sp. AJA228-03]
MPTEDEIEHAKIHLRAKAHAEATVYSLNNSYLTQHQKASVEAVYQFPLGLMGFAYGLLALGSDQTWLNAYWNASFLGALAWAFAAYGPTGFVAKIGFLTGGWAATLLDLALAAWALYEHRWLIAGLLAGTAFGLTSPAMLPTWLWAWQGKGMNIKYRIAKRLFGVNFPFEHHLRVGS